MLRIVYTLKDQLAVMQQCENLALKYIIQLCTVFIGKTCNAAVCETEDFAVKRTLVEEL